MDQLHELNNSTCRKHNDLIKRREGHLASGVEYTLVEEEEEDQEDMYMGSWRRWNRISRKEIVEEKTWLQKCSRLWRVILNMDEKRRMSR